MFWKRKQHRFQDELKSYKINECYIEQHNFLIYCNDILVKWLHWIYDNNLCKMQINFKNEEEMKSFSKERDNNLMTWLKDNGYEMEMYELRRKKMCLFCEKEDIERESIEKKEKLDNVLKIADKLIKQKNIKDVRESPVYSLIRAISNLHLYDIVRELYEGEDVTDIQSIYNDVGRYLNSSVTFNNSKSFKLGKSEIDINLSKDAVLVCAWSEERFINALLKIGKNVGNKFEYKKINHMATYIYPLGLAIVYNGNHSILSGILKGEGVIQANQTYDLEPTYDYMYFDGVYFRNKDNDEVIYKVRRFEIGILYEIGRLLAENGIR